MMRALPTFESLDAALASVFADPIAEMRETVAHMEALREELARQEREARLRRWKEVR